MGSAGSLRIALCLHSRECHKRPVTERSRVTFRNIEGSLITKEWRLKITKVATCNSNIQINPYKDANTINNPISLRLVMVVLAPKITIIQFSAATHNNSRVTCLLRLAKFTLRSTGRTMSRSLAMIWIFKTSHIICNLLLMCRDTLTLSHRRGSANLTWWHSNSSDHLNNSQSPCRLAFHPLRNRFQGINQIVHSWVWTIPKET